MKFLKFSMGFLVGIFISVGILTLSCNTTSAQEPTPNVGEFELIGGTPAGNVYYLKHDDRHVYVYERGGGGGGITVVRN